MKRGSVEIRIGLGSCGIASGAEAVRDVLQRAAKVKTVGCNGMCHLEPLVQVVEPNGRVILYANVTPETARLIVKKHVAHALVRAVSALMPTPAAGLKCRRTMHRALSTVTLL